MKILPVFGGFWDKLIKNDQKNKITDVLGKRKNYDSNLNDNYVWQIEYSSIIIIHEKLREGTWGNLEY